MKVFAERLKELRHDKGLTTRELGKMLDVSSASVVRWENNQTNIKAEEIAKVAKFFGVSTDYLLGLSEDF